MKVEEKRQLGLYILLSIVTCGVYHFIFFHQFAKDMNIICDGDGDETPGIGDLILFSLLTCGIYAFYWFYKIGNRQAANAKRYKVTINENGTSVLVWMLLGGLIAGIGYIIAYYILIKNMNALAHAYNQRGAAAIENGNMNYNQSAPAQINLVGRNGEFAGCVFPLNMNESIRIGRSSQCNIKFDAHTPNISRMHCTLYYDGKIWLTDNGSKCGTYLDGGLKLTPNSRMELQRGAGFSLGNRNVSFYIQ